MSDLTPRQPHDADGEPTAVVHTESATTPQKQESAPVSAVAGSAPGGPEPTAPQPEAAAPQPEAAPAAVASPAAGPARERWHRRRVPVLAAAAALLVGGLIGGGAVAIGAVAFDGHRGDVHGPRSGRDGGEPAEEGRVPHGPRSGRDGDGPAGGRDGDRFEPRGGAWHEQRRRGRDGSTPAPSGSAVPSSPAPSVSS